MTAQDPLPPKVAPPTAANEMDVGSLPADLTPTTRPRVGDAFDPRNSFFPSGLAADRVPDPAVISQPPRRRGLPIALVVLAVLVLGAAAAWDLVKGLSGNKSSTTSQTRSEGVVAKPAVPVPPVAPAAVADGPATAPAPAVPHVGVTHTKGGVEGIPTPPVVAPAAAAKPRQPAAPAKAPNKNCDPSLIALGLC